VLANLATTPLPENTRISVQTRYVETLLDRRMAKLGVISMPSKEESNELHRQAASKLRILSTRLGTDIKSCAEAAEEKGSSANLSKLAPLPRMAATAILNDAVAFCQKLANQMEVKVGTGEISDLRAELKKEEDLIAAYRKAGREKKASLDAAAALAAQAPLGTSSSDQLKEATGKLQDKIVEIESFAKEVDFKNAAKAVDPKAPPMPSESRAVKAAVAELRLESLDTVLKALSSGTTDLDKLPADERKAVLVVRLIPTLADEVKAGKFERERIRLAPLLLAKENQRLAVAGFKAEIAVLERRAQLRAHILAATEAEHLALDKAKKAVISKSSLLDAPFHKMLDSGPSESRFLLYTSLTYFDLAEEHRLSAELARLEMESASTDLAMAASRSAAMQWQSLATNIAAVLGDYHAQGIKPADWVELLKSFGIIGIAAK